jgi:hypothetical protein
MVVPHGCRRWMIADPPADEGNARGGGEIGSGTQVGGISSGEMGRGECVPGLGFGEGGMEGGGEEGSRESL